MDSIFDNTDLKQVFEHSSLCETVSVVMPARDYYLNGKLYKQQKAYNCKKMIL